MSEDDAPKKRRKSPTKGPPAWKRGGHGSSNAIQRLPAEKVALKEVDMDLQFRRAMQFTEWLMDRMEAEINGSELFEGVPMKFPGYLRELASAMNTLSLSHARWLKANEEMYERLSDDEKLAALGDWIPALYLRHPEIVTTWMRQVALKIQDTSRSTGKVSSQVMNSPDVQAVTGELPRRPAWTEVAAKVRADFRAKRDKAYGPPRKEPNEKAAEAIWAMRNKSKNEEPEEPDES